MRYVVRTTDGVIVTTLIPSAAVIGERRYALNGVGSRGDRKVLHGEALIDVGPKGYDIGDLMPDSVPGVTLEFPDIDGAIGKWSEADQAKVLSRRPEVPGEVATLDRYFRAAWSDNGKALGVDMAKAREIQRDRIRVARAPLLASLDAEYMRADERGDGAEKQRVAAKKQALRDATADPAIEAAATPEDLKAVWPAALEQS